MKKVLRFLILLIVFGAVWGCAYARQEVRADHRKISNEHQEKQGETLIFPIRFYRDYISRVDGDRCQMSPTCSQYCNEAIKKHGAFLGWMEILAWNGNKGMKITENNKNNRKK